MSSADEKEAKQPDKNEVPPTASFDGSIVSPGKHIGQFRIERELGRGAAGIVYLAHDTKLDRSVAIKSLPVELMENPKARTRFAREARVLASLNHPNIATIYDEYHESEGVGYLILEYVPGRTLAERIDGGKIKLQETLSIAKQIAGAVATAHEHDVIHRDLKPGNIKITPEDKVKVLDFGLAKALSGETQNQQSTITEQGRIIGTPAYMSPEQARGQLTDKCCDIWSFGCILYEMLTGKVPFEGETVSDTLAAILDREPDWEALPQSVPVNMRVLLRRCLEKDPRRHLQHIGDAGIELDETLNSRADGLTAFPQIKSVNRHRSIPVMLTCSVVVAVITGLVIWGIMRPHEPQSQPTTHFQIRPETTIAEEALWHHAIALSPDGRRLAFVDEGESGGRLLYLRDMDSIQARALPGTEGAISPFFSPDGQWIGYYDFVGKEVKKIAVSGGTPTTLCKQQSFAGGCWGPDNTIIFACEQAGLRRYTDFGRIEELTVLDASQGEWGHVSPQLLPGNNAILFTNMRADDSSMEVFLLQTGQRRTLLNDGIGVRYVQTGHLVFVRNKTLHAVPFDLDELVIKGTAMPVIQGVNESPLGSADFVFSENGTLAYIPAPSDERNLVWVDRGGKVEILGIPPRPYTSVRLSPDGARLAVTISHKEHGDVWIFDKIRLTHRQVTFDGLNWCAIWTPDGKNVVFDKYVGRDNLYLPMSIPADGSGEAVPLTDKDGFWIWGSKCFSPDGSLLLGHSNDIWILSMNAEGDPKPFVRKAGSLERHPDFSPDGQWVAYDSSETGRVEIYVRPFPGPAGIETISTNGGYEPLWSHDGKELFYRSGDKMMAVTVETDPDFKVDAPRELFKGHFWGSATVWGHTYDLESDGRFLMIQEDEESANTGINIVLNWFEELKRLVPTGRD